MNTEKVKARRLTQEEVEALDTGTEILVGAEMAGLPRLECYAPAHLTRPGGEFEGGFFEVETVFGGKFVTGLAPEEYGIYIADDEGEEVDVLQSAGLFINVALFIPGEPHASAVNALYSFLRKEYGEGVVELWSEKVGLVPDARFDVFEVSSGRGRKPADGPKKRRIEENVYAPYVEFVQPESGFRIEVERHTANAKKIPTI